jgi:hypothetical protein
VPPLSTNPFDEASGNPFLDASGDVFVQDSCEASPLGVQPLSGQSPVKTTADTGTAEDSYLQLQSKAHHADNPSEDSYIHLAMISEASHREDYLHLVPQISAVSPQDDYVDLVKTTPRPGDADDFDLVAQHPLERSQMCIDTLHQTRTAPHIHVHELDVDESKV